MKLISPILSYTSFDDNFSFFLFVYTIHYGSEFRKLVHVQDIDNLCKKLFSNPNAACRHATFLIEVFVHVAIENKRLNCLLCISANIGVAPNRRYNAVQLLFYLVMLAIFRLY